MTTGAGSRDDDPRYSRQVRFAPIGVAGQRSIARATVLVVGVGALGTHAADHLARAGVGRLILVDRDVVDPSNLQRQVLFDAADARAGAPKASAAAAHLLAVRPDGRFDPVVADFDAEVFDALPARPDLIIDGTDNFAVRFLINDLAVDRDLPWIYGGAVGAEGRACVVLPGETPCLRCLWPEPPSTAEVGTCETVGVLAPAVAHVAAFQVAEALKLLSGNLSAVTRGTLVVDVWRGTHDVRLRGLRPRPDCASCGTRELPDLRGPRPDLVSLCGRNAVQVRPAPGARVDLARLAAALGGAVDALELGDEVLRFEADGCRFSVFRGGRALLFGVSDTARARILYDRWVGATPSGPRST